MWKSILNSAIRSIVKYWRPLVGIIATLAVLTVLASCSTVKRHKLEVQVRCPDETGGKKFMIPEILDARL